MFYICMGLAGLLLLVVLFTFIFGKEEKNTEIILPAPDCCGAHEICEKGLKKLLPEIDYFNDEELDAYKTIRADAYTPEQLDLFRDILYTLRKEDIQDWLISLEKREIEFPNRLKQELLEMLK